MGKLLSAALALVVVIFAAPEGAAQQTSASARAASALVDAAIPAIVERAETTLPALKADLRETPGYGDMPEAMRAKLESYVDTFPELIRQAIEGRTQPSDKRALTDEVRAQVTSALDETMEERRGELSQPPPDAHGSVAALLEARFSARDLSKLADSLETPAGAAASRHAAQAAARSRPVDFATFPAAGRAEFDRFAATRSGQTYVREAGALAAVVEELLRLAFMSQARAVMENMAMEICAITGPERCAELGRR